MAENEMLEIRIDSIDQGLIAEIEAALGPVQPERWKETRDLVTVITVCASAVALVNALLDLKDRLSKKPEAPKVVILNFDRTQENLAEATQEALETLIK